MGWGWALQKGLNYRGKIPARIFAAFLLYWVCFEAWLSDQSSMDNFRPPRGNGQSMLGWLTYNNNSPFIINHDELFNLTHSYIAELKALGPVPDIRRSRRGAREEINNMADLVQVTNVIYQIRCNLLHKGLDPFNRNETKQVELAAYILKSWLGKIL